MDIANAPQDTLTIAGHQFNVFKPFNPGHALTEHEASAMNQLFSENIRNNFAKTVKDHDAAGTFDEAALQKALDDYQAAYEFGARRSSGVSSPRQTDPVTARAMELARNAVRSKIKELGGNLKDYTAADINARAKKAVEANSKFRDTATRQIEEEKGIDVGELDSSAPVVEKKAKAPKAAPAEAAA